MSTTITIRSTEEAVATIAGLATRVIANGNHDGHPLERVARIITSDPVLSLIRTAYTRRIAQGEAPRQACIGVGQGLIAHYCNSAGI